jgi:hypothetical protein
MQRGEVLGTDAMMVEARIPTAIDIWAFRFVLFGEANQATPPIEHRYCFEAKRLRRRFGRDPVYEVVP